MLSAFRAMPAFPASLQISRSRWVATSPLSSHPESSHPHGKKGRYAEVEVFRLLTNLTRSFSDLFKAIMIIMSSEPLKAYLN